MARPSSRWLLALLPLAAAQAHAQDTAPWRLVGAPAGPGGSSPIVYDSRRHVVVCVGDGGQGLLRVDEWDGTAWTPRLAPGPASTIGHEIAFDSRRGVTVLFGGHAVNSTCWDQTWEWDGAVWTLKATTGPTGRTGHVMAFDMVRGVTVLYGGSCNLWEYRDTWEWDGSAWTQRGPGPVNRFGAAMVYDSRRGMLVLFGGGNINAYGDTWERTPAGAWQPLAYTGPSPRLDADMVFDPGRGLTLLVGGRGLGWNEGPREYGTWQWDGVSWTQARDTGPKGQMVYDEANRRVVLFGNDLCPYGPQAIFERRSDEAWCFANCDGSTAQPTLNVSDFICFMGRFAAGDQYANCDQGANCVLDVNDFICFQTLFAAGCP